ncbi:unnamed protein product, partial [Laminaria digitata]
EEEEDEVVSLSTYLACSGRQWPWAGKDILWAEYVSLNGHHRWIRSDGCRHALLIVRGTMYLLEMPSEAANRHKKNTEAEGGGGPVKSAPPPPGTWFLRVAAATLKLLSIPLAPSE